MLGLVAGLLIGLVLAIVAFVLYSFYADYVGKDEEIKRLQEDIAFKSNLLEAMPSQVTAAIEGKPLKDAAALAKKQADKVNNAYRTGLVTGFLFGRDSNYLELNMKEVKLLTLEGKWVRPMGLEEARDFVEQYKH